MTVLSFVTLSKISSIHQSSSASLGPGSRGHQPNIDLDFNLHSNRKLLLSLNCIRPTCSYISQGGACMQNYNTRVSRGVQTSLTPPRPFEQYNLSSVSWIYLTQETPSMHPYQLYSRAFVLGCNAQKRSCDWDVNSGGVKETVLLRFITAPPPPIHSCFTVHCNIRNCWFSSFWSLNVASWCRRPLRWCFMSYCEEAPGQKLWLVPWPASWLVVPRLSVPGMSWKWWLLPPWPKHR